MANFKTVVLVILDGWGESEQAKGNAIANANLPTFQMLDSLYPKTLLQASGKAVGLPWQIMGNSEVGHQTIGSGQILYQYLPMITSAIHSKVFFHNEALLKSIQWTKEHNSRLHLLGLVSDGGVHSHIDHLFALLQMAKEQEVNDVFIHAVLDGRDTAPKSAMQYLEKLVARTDELGLGQIATISGRYFTMDRNQNWDRVEKAFVAMTRGEGIKANNAFDGLESQYEQNITDEFIEPTVIINSEGQPMGSIQNNDAVIFFNFRKDRARQITKAFVSPDLQALAHHKKPDNIQFTTFANYEEGLPVDVAFKPQEITIRVGEIISRLGKKQLRIAETEKFAHVTYFFNGGVEKPYPHEDRLLVPSKKVKSYAEIPEMSSPEITQKCLDALTQKKYDFILINFASPDMVGHTGNFHAGIKAVEVMDQCIDKIIKKVLKLEGCLLITADHGNIEEMINVRTGELDTKHSTNPVPCWLITPTNKRKEPLEEKRGLSINGMIVDIAPTVLELMGIKAPQEMIGRSLVPILQWI